MADLTSNLNQIRGIPGAGVRTLLAALPHTGRTHQIRVHSAYSGHPVLGDDKYGDKELNAMLRRTVGLNRMFLHAYRINFINPATGELLKLTADLPEELAAVLEALRAGA